MLGISDAWPQFLGKRMRVLVGDVLVEGVFLGLRPVSGVRPVLSDPPWAVLTDTGIAFIDPDSAFIQIYVREGRLLPPRIPDPSTARVDALGAFIENAQDMMQRAEQILSRSRRGLAAQGQKHLASVHDGTA
ncbi:hypothetical protein [Pigmentiphaga litoralis]|uniref:Uncharacterized protein n=1 Tax=Pigmentiphaga litoralis TaxID=516702 RepID=A0A7Y9IT86_9BURK|nr:hypothetical protein [Pigmentiphaga litoralis]NYE23868.1 hypothetical protein [Pigmentiphaga litoralis]NYE82518.1 hypothetical protein [Pigmentiphaga litoralis]